MKGPGYRLLACCALLIATPSCMEGRYFGAWQADSIEGIVQGDTIQICGRFVAIANVGALIAVITRCGYDQRGYRASLDDWRGDWRPRLVRPGMAIVRFHLQEIPLPGVGGGGIPKPPPRGDPPRPEWTGTALDPLIYTLRNAGIYVFRVM
ncbi:MAG TPA: hypothetical protein VK614_11035 [Allosphingosinicella sp.]|nr:hypothetical protein [Allosphingosinicella sp.]